ncbi:hypothetical protein MMC28_003081 [Mycoblastus sanguinarius]|nr:hypothetical protein [Mycoblastus sanguinarius]
MIHTLLFLTLFVTLITSSSLPPLTLPTDLPSLPLPANTTVSDGILSSNLTVGHMNPVLCRYDYTKPRLSHFTTCVPTLYRLYITPNIYDLTNWEPGDFKQWGPENIGGGCAITIDGGGLGDAFSVGSLLGQVIWALGKCFTGDVEGRNYLAKTRVGPMKEWWLTIELENLPGSSSNATVS